MHGLRFWVELSFRILMIDAFQGAAIYELHHEKPDSCYAKTKTAQPISAFVFATQIVHVQFIFFLNLKFQA